MSGTSSALLFLLTFSPLTPIMSASQIGEAVSPPIVATPHLALGMPATPPKLNKNYIEMSDLVLDNWGMQEDRKTFKVKEWFQKQSLIPSVRYAMRPLPKCYHIQSDASMTLGMWIVCEGTVSDRSLNTS